MDEALKIILKKLDEIDNRIKKLEANKNIIPEVQNQPSPDKPEPISFKRDPLFTKAVEILEEYDELSTTILEQALKIDKARAEKILDELEAAGLGVCYWKEV